MPREWFIIPIAIIQQAIELVLNERITQYRYDTANKIIIEKTQRA